MLDDEGMRMQIESMLLAGFLIGVSVDMMFGWTPSAVLAIFCGLVLGWMMIKDIVD